MSAGALPSDWGTPRAKTIDWYDSSILSAAGSGLTGREFLQAIADGRLPEPPMARLIGARLALVGDGEARFVCAPDESVYNPLGIVHGGLLCTLLDFAAGAAVQTALPAGVGFSSIDIKVSYLKALRSDGGQVEAHGKTLHMGRRVAFAEAHARNADGDLVGHAVSSLALLRP
jgi:uncharacterized protein (TIGR00369 family)